MCILIFRVRSKSKWSNINQTYCCSVQSLALSKVVYILCVLLFSVSFILVSFLHLIALPMVMLFHGCCCCYDCGRHMSSPFIHFRQLHKVSVSMQIAHFRANVYSAFRFKYSYIPTLLINHGIRCELRTRRLDWLFCLLSVNPVNIHRIS